MKVERPRAELQVDGRTAVWSAAADRAAAAARAHETLVVIALGALLLVGVAQLREPAVPWLTWDSHVYWEAALASDLYANASVGALGAYLYSPAFAQLIAPAGLLPWPVFLFGWAMLSISVAVALCRAPVRRWRWLWLPIATVAIFDIGAGNVNVLIAGAIVIGFRWPGAWSLLLLTKVTPGLALLWFGVRREWTNLSLALGVTALIVGISAAFEVNLWLDWVTMLIGNGTPHELSGDIAIPAHVRFPVALVLVAWGARTDRRWVVPVACLLLMPVIWPNTLALLIGSAALLAADAARDDVRTRSKTRIGASDTGGAREAAQPSVDGEGVVGTRSPLPS
jgi:Glycosyltransferase family 87